MSENGKSLYVMITILCCLLAASISLWVEASQDDGLYARKEALLTIDQKIDNLDNKNRADHKEIQQSLQKLILMVGQIQGRMAMAEQ